MNKIDPQSFGSVKHYAGVIAMVENSPWQWRKVANLLRKLRRHLHPWPQVDRTNQRKEAAKYVNQALIDTRLWDDVKSALRQSIESEFELSLN